MTGVCLQCRVCQQVQLTPASLRNFHLSNLSAMAQILNEHQVSIHMYSLLARAIIIMCDSS